MLLWMNLRNNNLARDGYRTDGGKISNLIKLSIRRLMNFKNLEAVRESLKLVLQTACWEFSMEKIKTVKNLKSIFLIILKHLFPKKITLELFLNLAKIT